LLRLSQESPGDVQTSRRLHDQYIGLRLPADRKAIFPPVNRSDRFRGRPNLHSFGTSAYVTAGGEEGSTRAWSRLLTSC